MKRTRIEILRHLLVITLGIGTCLADAWADSRDWMDCRASFGPGYSIEVRDLIRPKFTLIDLEEEHADRVRLLVKIGYSQADAERVARAIGREKGLPPFQIDVREDHDANPERLLLSVSLLGNVVHSSDTESGGYYENLEFTRQWLKNLPTCEALYRVLIERRSRGQ